MGSVRTRQSWNERLEFWEKPASDTEEAIIEQSRKQVASALGESQWLVSEGVALHSQGSYHNNTNVRRDSDMDLRLVHPLVYVHNQVNDPQYQAYSQQAYNRIPVTYEDVYASLRSEAVRLLADRFGAFNVDDTGNKAIRIKEIPGSRAKVDVIPCFVLNHIIWHSVQQRFVSIEGVAIPGRNFNWIANYPQIHTANGSAKRERTANRFKKMVRIFKRLRNEMKESGDLLIDVPSFMIECLVYAVEDQYFLVESDDRYDRTRRLALRMYELLSSAEWVANATEISGFKLMFFPGQTWTLSTAQSFIALTIQHLGNA